MTVLRGSAGVAVALLLSAVVITAQAPAATQYVWDGVFTDQQADRGEREYGRTCSHCHGLSLEGDGAREIPALVSDTFTRRWKAKTVQALFDSLIRSMPADDRGTLSARATADLIAYLLRANGAPAGETALPSTRDALATVLIDRAPTAAAP